MISIEFHGWVLECDREATLHAYSEVKYGGAESCTCSMCRNYITYREQVFPDEIIRLFTQLGIDLTKDVEVFHMAKESPYGHYYGGWFHFIGAIMKMSDPTVISQDFEIDFLKKSDLAHESLKGKPLVQVDFFTHLPWVLQEEEPD